jgi:hypothetical protein
MRLHEWVFPLTVWRSTYGLPGGEVNESTPVVEESLARWILVNDVWGSGSCVQVSTPLLSRIRLAQDSDEREKSPRVKVRVERIARLVMLYLSRGISTVI